MSGFDENPFGDPTIDNPFADPSIQQVAKTSSNLQHGLDNYEPFANHGIQPPTGTMTASQPAIMQPTQDPPPGYVKSAQQPAFSATAAEIEELKRRQEELDRKAADLARREEELRTGSYNARRNNWPPLPSTCPFQPCFYHDIGVDIPTEFQKIVRNLYYLWLFHAALMILNVIGGILLMFHNGEMVVFGMGIIYGVIFVPFSFLCWYRPAYKAFRDDSSFNFMVFFFTFSFQFVISCLEFLGTSKSGFCGIITALEHFDGSATGTLIALYLLAMSIGFGLVAGTSLLLITKIHALYRSSGASFVKAQQEFASEFLRNPHVQTGMQQAAGAAVQSQFSNRY